MEFIFDRTQADIDRVKELNEKYRTGKITEEERSEWAAGLKGALNAADLNRIEGNTEIIAEYLATVVSVKTWKPSDIPRVSDYKRIRDNVQKVRDAWAVKSDTPPTPEQPLNTYQKWNDIERILHDVDFVYTRTMESRYYCGDEFYAGEGVGII